MALKRISSVSCLATVTVVPPTLVTSTSDETSLGCQVQRLEASFQDCQCGVTVELRHGSAEKMHVLQQSCQYIINTVQYRKAFR
jgi:hypothetical protein